jgi:hypothetical protein
MSLDGIPSKLFYNFLMAIRFPWEQSIGYQTFLMLLDQGLEPNRACFIANSFFLKQGAKSIEGPWEIQYPMSYLEQMTLEAAGRFILAKPGDLKTKTGTSPNCAPLWNICAIHPVYWKDPDYLHLKEIPVAQAAKDKAEALSNKDNLMLHEIVSAVESEVEAQKGLI